MKEDSRDVGDAARAGLGAVANGVGATEVIDVFKQFRRPGRLEDGIAAAAIGTEEVLIGVDEIGAGLFDGLGEPGLGVGREPYAWGQYDLIALG